MSGAKKLWTPSESFTKDSNMNSFRKWVNKNCQQSIENYQDLWNWSVSENSQFWESILKYFNLSYSGEYSEVASSNSQMHETNWFNGIQLNYAEHVFKNDFGKNPALIFQGEAKEYQEISIEKLKSETGKIAAYLKEKGVEKGDRVCSMLPNSPQAVIGFLATNSLGAIWTSCSPDFGTKSIIDRFNQIGPKVFIAANAYKYNGRVYNKTDEIKTIQEALPDIQATLLVEYISDISANLKSDIWEEEINREEVKLVFNRVDFSHPIWILYSSGTTGKPKAITHSVGGILIEHYKALSLHQNVKPGDKFFWYSTTGWMMWNYATSALLTGGTVVIYDGSPVFPTSDILWSFAEKAQITHFGAGASYYIFCMKEGMNFKKNQKIKNIQSFGSTGSTLPSECFDWFYEKVNPNLWLISLSGGTDICSGFVGGNPFESIYRGEIQCRMLGVNLKAYTDTGEPVIEELGEMVIENALPSMPIYFWKDKDNQRYKKSYFEMYPGKWRHGDWIKITKKNSLIIYGRSDTTLNRGGIRIGTSEIYSATESVEEVIDSLVVCIDNQDGTQTMPIFIQLEANTELDSKLKRKIKKAIKTQFSARHIPDKIHQIPEVPYTLSGKKMEAPVKKILSGIPVKDSVSLDAMRNPKSLDYFVGLNFK